MKIERFEDIEAWKLARELTRKVYCLTRKPGFEKDYGLKRQIQDAAGSAMHKIAEGFDSETNAELIVQKHEGHIGIESVAGVGTTVHILLPAAEI
jgi:four helix bundle protein